MTDATFRRLMNDGVYTEDDIVGAARPASWKKERKKQKTAKPAKPECRHLYMLIDDEEHSGKCLHCSHQRIFTDDKCDHDNLEVDDIGIQRRCGGCGRIGFCCLIDLKGNPVFGAGNKAVEARRGATKCIFDTTGHCNNCLLTCLHTGPTTALGGCMICGKSKAYSFVGYGDQPESSQLSEQPSQPHEPYGQELLLTASQISAAADALAAADGPIDLTGLCDGTQEQIDAAPGEGDVVIAEGTVGKPTGYLSLLAKNGPFRPLTTTKIAGRKRPVSFFEHCTTGGLFDEPHDIASLVASENASDHLELALSQFKKPVQSVDDKEEKTQEGPMENAVEGLQDNDPPPSPSYTPRHDGHDPTDHNPCEYNHDFDPCARKEWEEKCIWCGVAPQGFYFMIAEKPGHYTSRVCPECAYLNKPRLESELPELRYRSPHDDGQPVGEPAADVVKEQIEQYMNDDDNNKWPGTRYGWTVLCWLRFRGIDVSAHMLLGLMAVLTRTCLNLAYGKWVSTAAFHYLDMHVAAIRFEYQADRAAFNKIVLDTWRPYLHHCCSISATKFGGAIAPIDECRFFTKSVATKERIDALYKKVVEAIQKAHGVPLDGSMDTHDVIEHTRKTMNLIEALLIHPAFAMLNDSPPLYAYEYLKTLPVPRDQHGNIEVDKINVVLFSVFSELILASAGGHGPGMCTPMYNRAKFCIAALDRLCRDYQIVRPFIRGLNRDAITYFGANRHMGVKKCVAICVAYLLGKDTLGLKYPHNPMGLLITKMPRELCVLMDWMWSVMIENNPEMVFVDRALICAHGEEGTVTVGSLKQYMDQKPSGPYKVYMANLLARLVVHMTQAMLSVLLGEIEHVRFYVDDWLCQLTDNPVTERLLSEFRASNQTRQVAFPRPVALVHYEPMH